MMPIAWCACQAPPRLAAEVAVQAAKTRSVARESCESLSAVAMLLWLAGIQRGLLFASLSCDQVCSKSKGTNVSVVTASFWCLHFCSVGIYYAQDSVA